MSEPVTESSALFYAKWVAKMALLVALASAGGLLAAIFWATTDEGASYASVVMSHSLTQQKLAPVMVVFGLLSVCVAALLTWLIALYSSHRIAGPLFRFSQNVKVISQEPFATPLAIRKTDLLQQDWQQFDAAQKRLRAHYGDLRDVLTDCQHSLAASDQGAGLAGSIGRLQEVERRVQL